MLDRKLEILKMLLGYTSVLNLFAKTTKGNTALVHAVWNGNVRGM